MERSHCIELLFINGTDSWATTYIENHDQARSITRFADDSPKYRKISGKLLTLLECSLTGTLYVYQGQEIGQINFKEWPIEKYEDVDVKNNYEIIKKVLVKTRRKWRIFKGIALLSRDHSRTPMPWTKDKPNAGFTGPDVKPWFSWMNLLSKESMLSRNPEMMTQFSIFGKGPCKPERNIRNLWFMVTISNSLI